MRITCSNVCPKSLGTLYCFWYSIPDRWSCRTSHRSSVDGKSGGGYKKFDQGDPEHYWAVPNRRDIFISPKLFDHGSLCIFFVRVYIHIHLYVCVSVCVCMHMWCVCICWGIGDLQCCVSFKCTENLLSYTHTHTHTWLKQLSMHTHRFLLGDSPWTGESGGL